MKMKTQLATLPPITSAIAVAMVCGWVYGYNTAIISGLSYTLITNTYFSNTNNSGTTSALQGLLTVCITIGAVIGSFLGPYLANIYGRRLALFICGICTIIPTVILAVTNTFIVTIIIRTVLGISVGFSCTVGPLYMAEISPVYIRGRTGVLYEVGLCTGILLAMFINYIVTPGLTGSVEIKLETWRYQLEFGLGAVPGLLLCILPIVLQETSIHHLTAKNKVEANNNNIEVKIDNPRIHDNTNETNSVSSSNQKDNTEVTQQAIQHTAAVDATSSVTAIGPRHGWRTLFTTRPGYKYLLVASLLCVTDMLTGINAAFYYAPLIFEEANLKNELLYTFATVGTWNLISNIFPYFLVDRWGRRPIFLLSLCIMAVSTLLLALNYSVFPSKVSSPLAIAFLLIFVGGWQLGTGALFFLLAAELFTDSVREEGLTFTNVLSWCCNIAFSFLFPVLTDAIHISNVFYIQFAICLVCTILSYFFFYETKNQSFAATQLLIKQIMVPTNALQDLNVTKSLETSFTAKESYENFKEISDTDNVGKVVMF
ncbi:unnamed protein product [Didymodactylos carnosus]|uniref:Major facilitator superfamily (MFS) profile domain-containing protein n=1 Tax=Didymodactylos carnosus TaxID=1234261 RepID=A0A814ITU2_9BILA|nr:unnamed protein product [Didymodactylos carnosus]CAF1440601.1 unnamed protein product [Didymodactylos carnosus]CAF3798534.1 unnamed protein product [Didymodactylos carnosus]CAF4237129.1 unnamed protein product [Didymodactylos carnosus]